MSMTYISQFKPGRKLTPFIVPEAAFTIARPYQASQTITKGQPLGEATLAVNAVQTLSQVSSPSAGTFTLSFNGFTTAAIAYNAAAAAVQSALEALPSIGAGNVACSGGALPGTPVVITFQGALAGQPVSAITVNSSGVTGGSFSIAQTTVGVRKGGLKAWTGGLLANPTTGPSVSATTGGSMPVGTYLAQMAWVTSTGETLPSLPVSVIVPDSTNDRIRFAAINAANTPDEATAIRYYLNGVLVAEVAVASGAIAQTDVDALPTSGLVPKGPQTVNTAYATTDGSSRLIGFAPCDIATDAQGGITLGETAGGEHGQVLADAPVFISGYFRMGDLSGIDATNGPQLTNFGRFIYGTYSDAEALFKLA